MEDIYNNAAPPELEYINHGLSTIMPLLRSWNTKRRNVLLSLR